MGDRPTPTLETAYPFQTAQASLSKPTKDSLAKEGRKSKYYLFAEKNPDPLAEAIDPEWSGALPHTVHLNGKGEIIYRHEGEIDPVTLRKAIVKELDKSL